VITIKRNDTLPVVDATLYGGDGNPINLSGATVRFLVATPDGTLVVDGAASVIDAANGKVRYAWAPADTKTSGTFRAEFQITFGDGSILTVPNDSYIPVRIVEDLK
jgi:hypothetical protein